MPSRVLPHALLGVVFCGCTTAYQASVYDSSPTTDASRAHVEHCLTSLGFGDHSSDEIDAQMIAAEPDLVAIWSTIARGSHLDPTPFVRVGLEKMEDGWSLNFVPHNGHGAEARYFSDAFARCIALHSPDTKVEVTSQRFLDLR